MQMAIMKTFSLRAAFLAMFGPSSMLSSNTFWYLFYVAVEYMGCMVVQSYDMY
jgi:hypothetical protein